MKVAVIGSRGLEPDNIDRYLPQGVTEIISGGAKGVDTKAAEYAECHGIKLTVFKPNYTKYRKGAPLKRNIQIIEYADVVVALWDGESSGTKSVIDECRRRNKKITVHVLDCDDK